MNMLVSPGQVCVPTFLGTNPTFITTTACNILAVNACNLGLAQVAFLFHSSLPPHWQASAQFLSFQACSLIFRPRSNNNVKNNSNHNNYNSGSHSSDYDWYQETGSYYDHFRF